MKVKEIIWVSIVGAVIAALIQFFVPAKYLVSSILMPNLAKTEAGRFDLSARLSLPSAISEKFGDSDLITYKEIISLNVIGERVLRKCNAAAYFIGGAKEVADRDYLRASEELAKKLSVVITKGKLIKISLESSIPVESAVCILNEYGPVLSDYLEDKGIGKVKEKTTFLGQQIEKKKDELFETSKQLLSFSENSGLVAVSPHFLNFLEKFSGRFISKSKLEIELNFFKTFYPDQTKLAKDLEDKMMEIEKGAKGLEIPENISSGRDMVMASLQKSPILSLYYYQLKQKQEATTKLINFLGEQYEASRLQEVESKSKFDLIQPAEVPFEASFPKFFPNLITILIVLFAGLYAWKINLGWIKNLKDTLTQ